MQRYFLEEDYQPIEVYQVAGEHYHHIVHVMRMVPSAKCYLVFNNNIAILAEIIEITSSTVLFRELEKEIMQKELPIAVTVACSYPKGDKLEWIIQKGTELGTHQFLGFPSENSIIKWEEKKRVAKTKRLNKIALEAAEQSHRQWLPSVKLLKTGKELVALFQNYDQVIVAYEESAKQGDTHSLVKSFTSLDKNKKNKILAIFGPEGGFSPKEITIFKQAGATLCGLGPRILRAETAPLYFLSALSYQQELLACNLVD